MDLLLFHLLFLSWILAAAEPSLSKPGCAQNCGKLKISYPFGIGPSCYFSSWFSITCNNSNQAYLEALNVEVLYISLLNQTITVSSPVLTYCGVSDVNSLSLDLSGSPFLFSKVSNNFVAIGSTNGVLISDQGGGGNVIAGCTSFRYEKNTNGACFGINCCKSVVPYYLDKYSVNVTVLGNDTCRAQGCSSAFLVDQRMGLDSFSLASFVSNSVPVVLVWIWNAVGQQNGTNCPNFSPQQLELANNSWVRTGNCSCNMFDEGNPYLFNGCQACANCSFHCGSPKNGEISCNEYYKFSPTLALGHTSHQDCIQRG